MKYNTSTIPEDMIERAFKGHIDQEDALELVSSNPHELLTLADKLRYETIGDDVTYIVNRNINFTDRCIGTCKFCAFKEKSSYLFTPSQIMDRVVDAVNLGATEVCIQGGLLNNIDLGFYLDILDLIRPKYPDLHIHAFSPMEVYHAANLSGISVKEALSTLKKHGLDTMPGTAAEILSERVRELVCPDKITTDEWIDVVTTAHKLDIPTTSTMMYGHIETLEERIEHMFTIRSIQDKTGKFTEFVPLPFMPYNNPLGAQMLNSGQYMVSGTSDLKMHALARIIFHNRLNNIQASWVKLGKKMAQFALQCGANDLGGTLMEEKISKSAGSKHGEFISTDEFEWMIHDAGRNPVKRNTVYERI